MLTQLGVFHTFCYSVMEMKSWGYTLKQDNWYAEPKYKCNKQSQGFELIALMFPFSVQFEVNNWPVTEI